MDRLSEDLVLMAGRSMSRREQPKKEREGSQLLEGVSELIADLDREIENADSNAIRELKRARRDLVKASGRIRSAGR